MQSRRDQVQAHLFVMNRLTTSLSRINPDLPDSPAGRTNRGMLFGIGAAVVCCAGALLIGLIFPGHSDTWRADGTVVLDKQSGGRFLYTGGLLRPLLNTASQNLLLGASPTVVQVDHNSLAHTSHGAPVGIAGAPDSWPAPADLVTQGWQVCSTRAEDDTSPSGGEATRLVIGEPVGGALGDDQALLITAPDGTDYLVWHGTRLRIPHPSWQLQALGYGSLTLRRVSVAFVNSLPQGPDLTVPTLPGLGEKGAGLVGLSVRVGQVFKVDVPGGPAHYAVYTRSGFTRVTATVAALLTGDPEVRKLAYDGSTASVREIDQSEVQSAETPGAGLLADSGVPTSPPSVSNVPENTDACVLVEPRTHGGVTVSVALVPRDTSSTGAGKVPAATDAACISVDQIRVRAGSGALIRGLAATGTEMGGSVFLVTDLGVKYLVPNTAALTALGYTVADERGLPAGMLQMLPTGPDLDPTAAASGSGKASPTPC
ncbi:type VII secretion protein EccB [Streptomyces sp. NPDC058469]|uniref:type VII secretion protein EccB n=1 Tax=Streptomyces sp. NPDC058469 TaxID=3346514 RepID=UPI0036580CCF